MSKPVKFSKLGDFERYVKQTNTNKIDVSDKNPGVYSGKDVFYKIAENSKVEWVINRICDHAGGILVQSPQDPCKAVCPLHNWEFDFNTLSYSKIPNQVFSKICKASLPFSQDGSILTYETNEYAIRVPDSLASKNTTKAKLRHIAHASVNLTLDDINIVTDPWLVGHCFLTGWWHKHPPKSDAFDLCNKADFIYISHNHPDHMHEESLQHISKEQHFIIPEFATDSVLKPMIKMGFKNLHVLEKGTLYRFNDTDLIVSILPCGDQRDDSALFLRKGNFSSLFTVDCNAVNHYILPENITLLMTNFAAGASGWPIVYESMPFEERRKVMTKNRNSQIFEIMKYCEVTKPKIYIPYAGYFSEEAERDDFIKENNSKNSPESVIEKVKAKFPDIDCINPIEFDEVEIENGNINKSNTALPRLYEVSKNYINQYLSDHKKVAEGFDLNKVANYFAKSGFKDDLVMYLVITDDDFKNSGEGIKISFMLHPRENGDPEKQWIPASAGMKQSVVIMSGDLLEKEFNELENDPDNKTFMLKVRKDSLWETVSKQLPFEELSIGFQCRIYRKPDVYHAKFWKFFTSEFIFGEEI